MTVVHIFDIDSTIADNTHRAKLLKKTCVVCLSPKLPEYHAPCQTCGRVTRTYIPQECWDQFFDLDLIAQDAPIQKAQKYIKKLRGYDVDIHFLTARDEKFREVTEFWLKQYFDRKGSEKLIMCPNNQHYLMSSQYKEKAVKSLMDEKYNGFDKKHLFFFYEDDPFNVDMFAKYGIVVKCPEAWEYLMSEAPTGVEKHFSVL